MAWLADTTGATSSVGIDPALMPFLRASDPSEADRLLDDLLATRVTRTIRDTVCRVLHGQVPVGLRCAREDLEDVCSEAVARVLRRLRELKADPELPPIQGIEAYAARVAEHTCYEYFRHRHPERSRLRNRIWYLLRHDPALALERAADGSWRCGLAGAREEPGEDAQARLQVEGGRLLDLVRGVLASGRGPIGLNELVDAVGQVMGLRPSGPAGPAGAVSSLESLADSSGPFADGRSGAHAILETALGRSARVAHATADRAAPEPPRRGRG